MLAIPGLDGGFLYNRSADYGSVTWASFGSTPDTRRYNVRLYRINTHQVTIYSAGGLGKTEWAVLTIRELDVTFLHNRLSDFRCAGRTLLDLAPATRRYKECHCRINTHEIAINSGGGSWEG